VDIPFRMCRDSSFSNVTVYLLATGNRNPDLSETGFKQALGPIHIVVELVQRVKQPACDANYTLRYYRSVLSPPIHPDDVVLRSRKRYII
jgi:hypothetical protein